MEKQENIEKIRGLYKDYNAVIKPLIAEVEARIEQFPLPLFNEIRALHDHISRCYTDGITDKQISEETEKAHRHVVRIMLDCYKYLNLTLHDSLLLFERQTKHVDLTVLKDGTFYPAYKSLRIRAIQAVRKAKGLESVDTYSALDAYQESYNLYTELEQLLDEVTTDVHWARVRFTVRKGMQVLLWILSAVASGIVSILLADLF